MDENRDLYPKRTIPLSPRKYCPPRAAETPNRATRQAMRELEEGKGTRFESAEALFKDLGI